MSKKLTTLILLVSIFFTVSKVQAAIALPFFNININQNSVGGDGTFNFHVRISYPPDPQTFEVEDFSIDTIDGLGSYTTGGISNDSTQYLVTQDQTPGWGSPTIQCVSDNPLVTTEPLDNGVLINSQGFSSIDCEVTNIKAPSKTPVLIIPGVMGTDILKDGEKLWLDFLHNLNDSGDQFMDPLQFGINMEPIDLNLSIGNVIEKEVLDIGLGNISIFNYTDKLIEEFSNQGYTQGATANDNLFLFPYDWRYGVSEENVNLLKQKIDDIRTQTGSEEVDVIAHSMGGLIMKKYAMDNLTDNHVRKSVFVGVPNTGAPSAIKVLLQGSNFDNPFLSEDEMKKIAKNLPAIYDLVPSEQYYNQKGSYIRVMNPATSTTADLDFNQTTDFLNVDHSLNSQALSLAQGLHTQEFDNFDVRTAGIDLYSINGCKAGTLGKIIELRDDDIFGNPQVSYSQLVQTPGDNTVPLESATNLPIDSANKYYALKGSHGKMLSQDNIRQQIVNIVSGSNLPINSNTVTQDITECKLNGKAISIFSPLSIDVTDEDGNHLGMTSDGAMYNDIPNANFEVMGEHKFVYLPTDEGQVYDIKVQGTGSGIFTLENATISDNQTTGTEVFSDVPVTITLSGTLNIGLATTLSIDTDSDGNIDEVIEADSVAPLSINELIVLIKEKISTLVVKDKLKQNLLKRIANLEKKRIMPLR